MTYLKNRVAAIWNWANSIFLALVVLLMAVAFFPTLSLDQKALSAYSSNPYNYCLVDVNSASSSSEWIYFNGQKAVFRDWTDGTFSSSILNYDVFMQETGDSESFTLTKLVAGKAILGSQEIGLTKHIADSYGLTLGSKLYFSGIEDPVLTLSAIYDDYYGIFKLDFYGDYGFLLLGNNTSALTIKHSFARFVEDYESTGFGPKIYLKSAQMYRLNKDTTKLTMGFVFSTLGVCALVSFLLYLHHALTVLPTYRLKGFKTHDIVSFVLLDKTFVYLPALVVVSLYTWLSGYGVYCLALFLLTILSLFLIDTFVSSLIASKARS
jgi:hypothetical protein